MPEHELLTTAQVLALLQIGRTKLWELVRVGAFPAYRLGEGRAGALRFRREEILGWVERNRVPRASAPSDSAGGDFARK